MDATTVAVDLAKDVFEVAWANRAGRVLQRKRPTLAARRGHNKAAIAVANTLTRILWAVWRPDQDFYSPLADAVA